MLLSYCDDEQKKQLFEPDDNARTPCLETVTIGYPECCEWIMSKMNPDQKTQFMTQKDAEPIKKILKMRLGVNEGNLKIMRILVESINDTNGYDLGAVFLFAARNNDITLGKLVLSKAKDEQMKDQIVNKRGNTTRDKDNVALHECANIENLPFLEYLLTIIKDDSHQFVTKNRYHKSALMLAVMNQNVKGIRLIMDKIKKNIKFKNQMLAMKDLQVEDAMTKALLGPKRRRRQTTKALMSYYGM